MTPSPASGLASRTLFQLSYPLFLQSLLLFGVMAADMVIWSAHGPATATALSVAGQVLRIAVELSAVMCIGGVLTISQRLGAGDAAGARRAAEIACIVNAGFGLALGLLLATGGPLILRAMALDPAIEADAALFLWLTGAAMAFLCFGNAAIACLRGFGHSRTVMVMALFGAAIYLGLEYTLVLGPGPLPALGAGGAGTANLLTRVIFAAVLAVAVARALGLRLRPALSREDLRTARRMAGLALPSVSDFIAYGFYQMILLGFVATRGEVEVLTRAYAMIAVSFLTLVIMAVCQGTEVLIGYRIGAGDNAAAQRQGLRSALAAAGLSTACAVALFALAGAFTGLFTADPAVHALTRDLLWLSVFLAPCFAVNMILFHALRAVGDVRWPVLVSQGLSWGFGLPLAWWLCIPAEFGVTGVWYAFIAEELAKALAMLWRWQVRRGPRQGPVAG